MQGEEARKREEEQARKRAEDQQKSGRTGTEVQCKWGCGHSMNNAYNMEPHYKGDKCPKRPGRTTIKGAVGMANAPAERHL
eukprot:gene19389-21990_t